MNSKIVCISLFVILCAIPMSYGIMCYRCLNEAECKNPSYVECNAAYATETVQYLDTYFLNVTAVPSNSFDCVRLNVTTPVTSYLHKGCIYSSMDSCRYDVRKNLTSGSSFLVYNKCYQCNNFNGCNPADRAYVSVAALVLPLLFVLKLIVQ